MYLINLTKSENGSYSALQNVSHKTVPPGTAEFPEMFYNIFYPSGKRAAGFVDLTMDGDTISNVTWNEEAYQAWATANPEHPEQEPQATLDERVTTLEGDTAELHEALDMILTGVTE